MSQLLYVCPNHPGLGEIMAGMGTTAQFLITRCVLCELAELRAQLAMQPEVHKAPESAQTPPDTPAAVGEGHSQSSPVSNADPKVIA